MSVLRDRIMTPGVMGAYHPATTPATPMTMPLAQVSYDGEALRYEMLHPAWAAEGAPYYPGEPPIAHRADAAPWAEVIPAGKP